jgi:UDP-N-acetylmuramate: L-alanyl-gamma-D-glutamyl-meso-diaminopimelate ligase
MFQQDFAQSLALADHVIVAAAHLRDKVPENLRISEEDLVVDVRKKGIEASFLPTPEKIIKTLSGQLRRGDCVVILSNGGFGAIHERLLESLERRRE